MRSLIVIVDPLMLVTVPAMAGIGVWPMPGPFKPPAPPGPRKPKPNPPWPPWSGPAATWPESGSLEATGWLAAAEVESEPLDPEVTAQTMPNVPPARTTAAAPSAAFLVQPGFGDDRTLCWPGPHGQIS